MTATTMHFPAEQKVEPTIPAPRAMSSSRRPKVISNLTLAALPTAVGCSRMFVRITLKDWGLEAIADTGELLMSELVTNAVKSTGVMDESPRWSDLKDLALIYVRLVVLDDGLIIEVADRDKNPPVIPEQTLDAEGGRGLFLVETMSKRWDFYHPRTGGKVVWCELELPQYELTEHGLPKRVRAKTADIDRRPAPPVDVELLRRVVEGLEKL